MLRLVLRTNVVLLFLVGVGYVVWAERPRGTIFGGLLCFIAVVLWSLNARRHW